MPDPVEPVLRAIEPAVRLVRLRHLRRARAAVADGLGGSLPLWLPATALRPVLAPGVDPEGLPAVLLLPEPDDLVPRPATRADLLRVYWRLLVQADVLRTLLDLPDDAATARLTALGAEAECEVRTVLAADHLVARDARPAAVWRAFAAVAADAGAFDPPRFARLFPLLADSGASQRLFAELSPNAVAERLRPAGATVTVPPPAAASEPAPVGAEPGEVAELVRRGNSVRAAVRLAAAGDPAAGRVLRGGLVARLAGAFGWDAGTAAGWHAALLPLLAPAGGGGWTRTTRALYDLQKIAADPPGPATVLDPLGWLASRGRRPLVRPLPQVRPVRLVRHLAAARGHLSRAAVRPTDRDRLDALLADAQHLAEAAVRDACGPVIQAAVGRAGLAPGNLPERVALDAVTAELLDRVCERGFARFADLRDAVARNGLKLPDLVGPGEWWRGDALLRADRRLGHDLPGVYRPAEAYLRAVHRATAAAFGTPAGRWLSLWVLLPFGGGLMTVEFGKYLAAEVGHVRAWVQKRFPPDPEPALPLELPALLADLPEHHRAEHAGLSLGPVSVASALVLGGLFLLLIHRPTVRKRLVAAVGAGAGFLFLRLPAAVWNFPPVRAVRTSPAARVAAAVAGVPLAVAAGVAVPLAVTGAGWHRLLVTAGGVFLLLVAAFRTAPGRRLEEELAEAGADGWRVVRHNLLPGLVGWVVWAFRTVADRGERALYGVDEWLRFRPRDGRGTLLVKAAAAAVWVPLAYLLRFAFYLLVEPQVNPVKHFPVVTVSHKLLLPAVPSLVQASGLSEGTVLLAVSGVPGVFGFVAWELKESWRLYAANRSRGLPAAAVGHHGETVRGLLRPGFHSGTVPKLFARLRRATDAARADRAAAELAAVAHAVERFADRHLVAYLRGTPSWAGLTPGVGHARLGVRTAAVGVGVKEFGPGELRLLFALTGDRVTAHVAPADWEGKLTHEQVAALAAAVAGLCRQATGEGGEPADDWNEWVRFWGGATV